MGKIIHIEVTSPDPKAATEFYASAFGWTSTASPYIDEYFTAETGDGSGIDAAVMSDRYQGQRTILWIEVEDLDATLDAVRSAGGTVGEFHDVPGQGRIGYVTAPDGVVVGLKQPA